MRAEVDVHHILKVLAHSQAHPQVWDTVEGIRWQMTRQLRQIAHLIAEKQKRKGPGITVPLDVPPTVT